ncbi:NAD(P)-binding protein [Hypoxylon trugodes]|uniref:NAD(P)-binding protein n=1 Tax=Hypoxylon trugodes TaxID=326681 RepID=UPI00218CFEC3|nr:NAD(P)-binding protein [Hypoxylon trugodes]KAI1386069.1 NAD(P)-binding protein [Hypoxylon trugodes]
MEIATTTSPRNTVFVTGATGYIGGAVCRVFARAGWRVFGLVRNPEAIDDLIADEVIPIVGSISKEPNFLNELYKHTQTFDVIISCTEAVPFCHHYEGISTVLELLSKTSNEKGVKPLVLMTSSCKDYGTTSLHGAPDLVPHTETTPLGPPGFLHERTFTSLKALEHSDLFDAAILRPTPLFGYGSSYCGLMFEVAAASISSDAKPSLDIPADFSTILHSCHIDDCAAAYLALATHAEKDRVSVAGECFNISGRRYETLGEVAGSLAREYGFVGGAREVPPGTVPVARAALFGFSQWVDSSKIRELTGWSDKRALLSEDLSIYRGAYEVAVAKADEGVRRVRQRAIKVWGELV